MEDEDFKINKAAIELILYLVGKEYGLQEAKDIALKAIKHEDSETRRWSLFILQSLRRKNFIDEQAYEAALQDYY